jgi:hypothetical protein
MSKVLQIFAVVVDCAPFSGASHRQIAAERVDVAEREHDICRAVRSRSLGSKIWTRR